MSVMDRHEQIWIKLAQLPNELSKRLTPQRDETKLTRAPERGGLSVRDLVVLLRDYEALTYPKLHLIATQEFPNLQGLAGEVFVAGDPRDKTLTTMSQFRRLRMSTISLLRELPGDAWERMGRDGGSRPVTIEDLALELVQHDAERLAQIDATLIARDAWPVNVEPLLAEA
jgi:hypothetical protein